MAAEPLWTCRYRLPAWNPKLADELKAIGADVASAAGDRSGPFETAVELRATSAGEVKSRIWSAVRAAGLQPLHPDDFVVEPSQSAFDPPAGGKLSDWPPTK